MRQGNVPLRPGRVLDAYRQTQAEVRATLEAGEAPWMRVGALLENACLLPADQRGAHLSAVVDSVRATLGPEQWAQGHRMDPVRPNTDETLVGRFRTYCEIVEDAGALTLADAMLAAYVDADPEVDVIEHGRVEAVRARLAWKSGDLDAATERYRRVATAGRQERSDELKVRALIGQAIVARVSGNYPRTRERAKRAAMLAERRGMTRLAAVAYQILTVGFAVASDFGAAIPFGWRAYLGAIGDPIMESEALAFIGQLFLDMGHPVPAAAAFRAVIARAPTDRLLVPSLAGLAVAAGRTGDRDAVMRVEAVIEDRIRGGATPYLVASAQLELASAWEQLGVKERTERAKRHALQVAIEHGFHEIAHYAEQKKVVVAPVPDTLSLDSDAVEVADAVLHLMEA